MRYAPLNLSPEEIVAFTSLWLGERSADGRPRVDDSVLQRMEQVTVTQAWGVLREEGYHYQYAGGWVCTKPGDVLVGRAVTAVYLPARKDLRDTIFAAAAAAGCIGDQVSWPIDTLVAGDVYVADVMGKTADGPVIGDNLATSILTKARKGVVHDAAIRDSEGVRELTGFVCFCRGYHPSYASPTVLMAGINFPIHIGGCTAMPGDVVLGKDDGVVFIPAHLAGKVVMTSEIIRLRDIFGKLRLAQARYTPGEIDRTWEPHVEADFRRWLRDHLDELPVPRETVQGYLTERPR